MTDWYQISYSKEQIGGDSRLLKKTEAFAKMYDLCMRIEKGSHGDVSLWSGKFSKLKDRSIFPVLVTDFNSGDVMVWDTDKGRTYRSMRSYRLEDLEYRHIYNSGYFVSSSIGIKLISTESMYEGEKDRGNTLLYTF